MAWIIQWMFTLLLYGMKAPKEDYVDDNAKWYNNRSNSWMAEQRKYICMGCLLSNLIYYDKSYYGS
jgi:hypothetical protein